MDLPRVGLGTMLLKESCEQAIVDALKAGCTVIDTSEHYGNLDLVGAGLAKSEHRESAFVVAKLSGLPAGEYEAVKARMQTILDRLGLTQVPLCLIHWPGLCTWDHTDATPLDDVASFSESTFDQFKANIAEAWGNMSKLKAEGLVAEIGTSNFYQHHLDELSAQCDGARPFANEIYIDATNQEQAFVSDMQTKGIKVLAYRSVRYPFPTAIENVAQRYGVSKQTVVFGWLISRGVFPLVKCRGAHIKENIEAPLALKLTPEDLEEISGADVGIRKSSEW